VSFEEERQQMFGSNTGDILKTAAGIYRIGSPKECRYKEKIAVQNTSVIEDVIIRIIKNTYTKNAERYNTTVFISHISVVYYDFFITMFFFYLHFTHTIYVYHR
jgi:hypothetical protein